MILVSSVALVLNVLTLKKNNTTLNIFNVDIHVVPMIVRLYRMSERGSTNWLKQQDKYNLKNNILNYSISVNNRNFFWNLKTKTKNMLVA